MLKHKFPKALLTLLTKFPGRASRAGQCRGPAVGFRVYIFAVVFVVSLLEGVKDLYIAVAGKLSRLSATKPDIRSKASHTSKLQGIGGYQLCRLVFRTVYA